MKNANENLNTARELKKSGLNLRTDEPPNFKIWMASFLTSLAAQAVVCSSVLELTKLSDPEKREEVDKKQSISRAIEIYFENKDKFAVSAMPRSDLWKAKLDWMLAAEEYDFGFLTGEIEEIKKIIYAMVEELSEIKENEGNEAVDGKIAEWNGSHEIGQYSLGKLLLNRRGNCVANAKLNLVLNMAVFPEDNLKIIEGGGSQYEGHVVVGRDIGDEKMVVFDSGKTFIPDENYFKGKIVSGVDVWEKEILADNGGEKTIREYEENGGLDLKSELIPDDRPATAYSIDSDTAAAYESATKRNEGKKRISDMRPHQGTTVNPVSKKDALAALKTSGRPAARRELKYYTDGMFFEDTESTNNEESGTITARDLKRVSDDPSTWPYDLMSAFLLGSTLTIDLDVEGTNNLGFDWFDKNEERFAEMPKIRFSAINLTGKIDFLLGLAARLKKIDAVFTIGQIELDNIDDKNGRLKDARILFENTRSLDLGDNLSLDGSIFSGINFHSINIYGENIQIYPPMDNVGIGKLYRNSKSLDMKKVLGPNAKTPLLEYTREGQSLGSELDEAEKSQIEKAIKEKKRLGLSPHAMNCIRDLGQFIAKFRTFSPAKVSLDSRVNDFPYLSLIRAHGSVDIVELSLKINDSAEFCRQLRSLETEEELREVEIYDIHGIDCRGSFDFLKNHELRKLFLFDVDDTSAFKGVRASFLLLYNVQNTRALNVEATRHLVLGGENDLSVLDNFGRSQLDTLNLSSIKSPTQIAEIARFISEKTFFETREDGTKPFVLFDGDTNLREFGKYGKMRKVAFQHVTSDTPFKSSDLDIDTAIVIYNSLKELKAWIGTVSALKPRKKVVLSPWNKEEDQTYDTNNIPSPRNKEENQTYDTNNGNLSIGDIVKAAYGF